MSAATPPPCCAPAALHEQDPTDERAAMRLAGVARRTRRAAHQSRAPTAANPGHPPRLLRLAAAPSPLPTALAAHCRRRLSRLRAQLLQRRNFWLPPPQRLKPGAWARHRRRGICRWAREPRHARRRPWMYSRRSTRRGTAPAGRDADRVDLDALDLVGDVGSRWVPVGLEVDVRGRLRAVLGQRLSCAAVSARPRVSAASALEVCERGQEGGMVGKNAAQAGAGHEKAHQVMTE